MFAHQLRDLFADTEYQVQVGDYRSDVYRLSVWMRPEVVSISLLYRYPDYLQLADREVLFGGDIAAAEGSEVVVSATVNKALEAAALIFERWRGDRVARCGRRGVGRYAVHYKKRCVRSGVAGCRGRTKRAGPRVQNFGKGDQAPRIRVRFPKGDDEATPIEEVAFGFSVKDDYGIADYGLQYEVAGRAPVRVSLKKEAARVESAEGEHPIALEDLGLAAGDFVMWLVWAEDGKPGRAAVETTGDPYFLEIRPFERRYRQAISNEGEQRAQGQQRGGASDQKQVIIAIYNLRKRASGMDGAEFDEQKQAIGEAQQTVRRATRNATEALTAEFVGVLTALADAAFADPDAALARALGHAQRAYRHILQRRPNQAEIVQRQGRQRGADAQQRALDGLELARRRDFREEASTLQQQLAETAEAKTKIEELTRRQAAINEDVAQLISEMENLERESREEAQRRLEQLRESQRQTMDALDAVAGEIASGDLDAQQARRAREQLEGARRQMGRSAQNLACDQLQRARAAGQSRFGCFARCARAVGQFVAQCRSRARGDVATSDGQFARRTARLGRPSTTRTARDAVLGRFRARDERDDRRQARGGRAVPRDDDRRERAGGKISGEPRADGAKAQ